MRMSIYLQLDTFILLQIMLYIFFCRTKRNAMEIEIVHLSFKIRDIAEQVNRQENH